MLNASTVSVSPLKAYDDLTDFRCERQEYSGFLRNPDGAFRVQQQNLGATYLFRSAGTIIGFITVTMSSLRKQQNLISPIEEGQVEEIPCLLLTHMARDLRYKAEGAGKIMTDWAINLGNELSRSVGCRFVTVEIEQEMITLFQRYGFELLPPDSNNRHYVMFFDLGIREASEP